MFYLRQSTASQTRIIGAFIDSTGFTSPMNGLSIANTDVKLSKNGAAAVNKNSGGGTFIVNGTYAVTYDATDSNTVGELRVSILKSGALLVEEVGVVLEEAVYDQLFAASAPGAATVSALAAVQTDITAIKGTAWTDAASLGAALAAALTEQDIADAVWNADMEDYVSGGASPNLNISEYILADFISSNVLRSRLYGPETAVTAASSTTATGNTGETTADDHYKGQLMRIIAGTGVGQVRRVVGYVNSTKVFTVEPAWTTTPDTSSLFVMMPAAFLSEPRTNTTIATLASQTSFTLTAGSAKDDAYNGRLLVAVNQSNNAQKAVGVVDDYVGSTRTVTLKYNPNIYTMAVGDAVMIL